MKTVGKVLIGAAVLSLAGVLIYINTRPAEASPNPSQGTIPIALSPANTVLLVNGTPMAAGIHTLDPGNYQWIASANGYISQNGSFNILAGDNSPALNISLIATGGGTQTQLNVSSNPDGATVELGGTVIGITNFSSANVQAGSYLMTVTKAGYQTISKNITIVAGQMHTETLTLTLMSVYDYNIAGYLDTDGIHMTFTNNNLTAQGITNQNNYTMVIDFQFPDMINASGQSQNISFSDSISIPTGSEDIFENLGYPVDVYGVWTTLDDLFPGFPVGWQVTLNVTFIYFNGTKRECIKPPPAVTLYPK